MRNFWRKVFTVAAGTGIAQLILMSVFPILTRNLDKESLGLYFYGISAATIFIVVANFRFDIAIFSEDNYLETIQLLKTSIVIAAIISFIFFVITYTLSMMHILPYDAVYWLLISIILFCLSINAPLSSIYIQKLQYSKLSIFKVLQAAIISIGLLATIKIGQNGKTLLAFHTLGMIISTIFFIVALPKFKKISLFNFSYVEFKKNIVKYKKYPLLSMPAGLINSLSIQLPVILISYRFGAEKVAIYALMMRVMLAPISLIGKSILSVFKEGASSEYKTYNSCSHSYSRTFKSLFLISIIPFFIGLFFIKDIFILLFGKDWAEAGIVALIMLPTYLLKFIASPLSYVFFICDGQKYDLFWQISLLISTCLIFMLPGSFMLAVQLYSIIYSLHYLAYLLMSYKLSRS